MVRKSNILGIRNPRIRGERQWGRNNIWRNNDQDFTKVMEDVTMGLISIMNLKQDKHKEKRISRFSIVRWSETKDKGKTLF